MHRSVPLMTLAALMLLLFAAPANRSFAASDAPTVVFDHVPAYNSYEDLTGHVTGVMPADYFVAVYIKVTGWWTKPTFASPLTAIAMDGTWKTDITTGGSDPIASDIAAFLVPSGYTPPAMSGGAILPQELYMNAIAYTSATRRAARTIDFSGYTWEVKNTPIPAGPGPNYFSDDEANVSVDANGYLHLKITQRGGIWYCSEVINTETAGYGAHTIVTDSRIDMLDKNAVLGYFTWDDSAPQYHYREIDIEFSRWGIDGGPNGQYVIQPWDTAGNRHQFYYAKLPELDSTHRFKWLPDSVQFSSLNEDGTPSETWTYSNTTFIPPAGGNIRLNLWLINGQPPSDGQDVEVVIKSYHSKPPYGTYLPSVIR